MQVVVDAGRLKSHSMADFCAGNVSEPSSDEEAPAEDPYRHAANDVDDSDVDASDDADEMDEDSDDSDV